MQPIVSTGCPWKDTTEFARHVKGLYEGWKNSMLLKGGGIENQPAWYWQAMLIGDQLVNRHQAQVRAKEQEELRRRRGH